VKNYYQLLEIQPEAPADAVKRAFRQQIARYHPDKVQHLGHEFQAMAADRAAELTEAYRILSDPASRAEYDRLLSASAGLGSPRAPAAASPPPPAPAPPPPEAPAPTPVPDESETVPLADVIREDRARGDAFVRRAALGRLRLALEQMMGNDFEQPSVRGFDLAIVPKPKLFGRSRGPRLLVRFVPCVDAATVADAWAAALKWHVSEPQDVCVLLIGATMATARELAEAIAQQRRRPTRGPKVMLVPIDARDWRAHMPTDTPEAVRVLLDGLRTHGK
jgi:DnaJ-like protein